jgi:hypothetical protein
MDMPKRAETIDQVFEEFLADQEARLSPKTYRRYDDIVDLFGSYLERYWPGRDEEEYSRITKAGGTYCGTFGPEGIIGGLSEFLGYFMPHKVMASKETMKAAGTVTKKLVKWLAERGYVEDAEALETAEERAREAAHDLPAARELADFLADYVDEHAPEHHSMEIEDHFTVSRTGPGKLWLEPLTSGDREIGPIPVPREVSCQCRVGWDISGIAVRTRKGWRLAEVWNVSP